MGSVFLTGPETWIRVSSKLAAAGLPHAFLDNRDWFVAKETSLFQPLFQPEGPRLAEEMNNLLEIRTCFICLVLFQAEDCNCLFDHHRSGKVVPKTVPIPEGILNWGNKSNGFPPGGSQCCAIALGSVTICSDLDFTIRCPCPGTTVSGMEAIQLASLEIDIAEMLTLSVHTIWGKSAGQLFDTNFYTNTFAFATSLGHTATDPVAGLSMALYAAARGMSAARRYSRLEPRTLNKNYKDLCKQKVLQKHKQKLKKYWGFVAGEWEVKSFWPEEDHRASVYFRMLRQVLEKGGDDFRMGSAVALVYANEAYWVEGAINDVVMNKETLTREEAVESVLMNLGYALEHLVHEFERGVSNNKNVDAQIAYGNFGDGLFKFAKYMKRVRDTCDKMKWQIDEWFASSKDFHEISELAKELCAKKKDAQVREKEQKDLVALPSAYVWAFNLPKTLSGDIYNGIDFVKRAIKVCGEVVFRVLEEWPTG